LAYMYDRSLDALGNKSDPNAFRLFTPWQPFTRWQHGLGRGQQLWSEGRSSTRLPRLRSLQAGQLLGVRRYSSVRRAGQLYVRGGRSGEVSMEIDGVAGVVSAFDVEGAEYMVEVKSACTQHSIASSRSVANKGLRKEFSETAFFLPHVKIDDNMEAFIEFKVPDSATDWNLVLHALTTDLRSGSLVKTASSSKSLLVRPYLPRFLRERDQAEVKVVLNNDTGEDLSCLVDLQILDEKDGHDISDTFGLKEDDCLQVPVIVPAQGENSLTFKLDVPEGVGLPTLWVMGHAENLSDGEQRSLPILPSRMYLQQSRFAALDGAVSRSLVFTDMSDTSDKPVKNEKLVVTVDGRLFQSALTALPYLVSYPYECTEQTMNRYLSASILSALFVEFPEAEKMAREASSRVTGSPAWKRDDPNRRMFLEETPWLNTAQGGMFNQDRLINLLVPENAEENRLECLAKLRKLQDSSGGFPWFSGGKPSPYMTCYILIGFAKGQEFGLEIPAEMAKNAWKYMTEYYHDSLTKSLQVKSGNHDLVTYLGYLLTCYSEDHIKASGFSNADKKSFLEYSFNNWQKKSRLMKSYLSLTLARNGRLEDARLVFDSVLDRANNDPDLGISWTPEDRSWLWTRDTIEGHAFALRVMTELYPEDARTRGLVKWLLLNKKLNHWKSTRASAEAIYALAFYLDLNGELGQDQEVLVRAGDTERSFEFESRDISSGNQHWVIPGTEMNADFSDTITVKSATEGIAFASATWHFSTDQPPLEGQGDLLHVSREFYRRVNYGNEWKLIPLKIGDPVAIGDEVEVHLAISSRFPVEYIQLRDPRPAGFEPEESLSGYRWQMRLSYYEEIRDNGANFFFENLPDGQFTMKHRLRANMAGEFLVGPATMQSMYAPEFTAYSSGWKMVIKESIK